MALRGGRELRGFSDPSVNHDIMLRLAKALGEAKRVYHGHYMCSAKCSTTTQSQLVEQNTVHIPKALAVEMHALYALNKEGG